MKAVTPSREIREAARLPLEITFEVELLVEGVGGEASSACRTQRKTRSAAP